jgi:hypothetical protein
LALTKRKEGRKAKKVLPMEIEKGWTEGSSRNIPGGSNWGQS